jgi:hypothetical protein
MTPSGIEPATFRFVALNLNHCGTAVPPLYYIWYVIFFFNRRCNLWWVLACLTIWFHSLLSLHFSLQFLTFIFFKSSSTWLSHLNLGFPTGLDRRGSHSVNFLTVLFVSILITGAAHRDLCDFINLTIFSFLIRVSNSSFVFILPVPSLSCVGPYIILRTLLSKPNFPSHYLCDF